jgi:hypothetical protein
MPVGRPPVDEKKRFLEKVEQRESGCHEWASTFHRDGYGKFYFRSRQEQAHRVSYKLFVGEIPSSLWVLHKCDNRKCVNPKHLFLGNSVANVRDMDKKRRRGTRCALTKEQAKGVLQLLTEGFTQQTIANRLGIHQTAVSRIKLGKTMLFKD